MKNKDLFEKTVLILLKAYQNDTLLHSYCSACAVGNLVADAIGTRPLVNSSWKNLFFENNQKVCWKNVFYTMGPGIQRYQPHLYEGEAKRQIDATGYTVRELMKIEYSFESVEVKGKENDDQHQFDGLMAVIDVLQEIHECTDTEVKEAKSLFVKSA